MAVALVEGEGLYYCQPGFCRMLCDTYSDVEGAKGKPVLEQLSVKAV